MKEGGLLFEESNLRGNNSYVINFYSNSYQPTKETIL